MKSWSVISVACHLMSLGLAHLHLDIHLIWSPDDVCGLFLVNMFVFAGIYKLDWRSTIPACPSFIGCCTQGQYRKYYVWIFVCCVIIIIIIIIVIIKELIWRWILINNSKHSLAVIRGHSPSTQTTICRQSTHGHGRTKTARREERPTDMRTDVF